MTKKTIGLIYGGKSSEHEVSLRTAFSLLNAVNYQNYNIIPIYIELDGNWIKGEQISCAPTNNEVLRLSKVDTNIDLFSLKKEIDIFFPVIHGPFGEDGTLQGLLEMLDVPYIGCGVLGSSTGMDKVVMKDIFQSSGIPQGKYIHFTRNEINQFLESVLEKTENTLGYPCFIKPANLGSSVGIGKAKNREELIITLKEAAKFDRRVIIEEFINGREIEIGVLGNETLKTSVIGEIIPNGEFYDYAAKYKNIGTKLQIPADIPVSIKEEMEIQAKRAFKALDCSGLSRVDFFLDETNNRLLINEINTMPGFTEFSMYPMLFKEANISYSNLIEELISLGFERYNEKKQNQILAESLT